MLVFVQYVIEIIQLEGMGIRVTSSWVQHVYECRGGSGGGGGPSVHLIIWDSFRENCPTVKML